MCDRPQARPNLEVRIVDDETVILDQDGEHIHQLNATASFIWERCDGSVTLSEIAQELAATFEVDPEVTAGDVQNTVLQFSQLGLLVESEPGNVSPDDG